MACAPCVAGAARRHHHVQGSDHPQGGPLHRSHAQLQIPPGISRRTEMVPKGLKRFLCLGRRPESIHTLTFVGTIAVRRELTTGWCAPLQEALGRLPAHISGGRPLCDMIPRRALHQGKGSLVSRGGLTRARSAPFASCAAPPHSRCAAIRRRIVCASGTQQSSSSRNRMTNEGALQRGRRRPV